MESWGHESYYLGRIQRGLGQFRETITGLRLAAVLTRWQTVGLSETWALVANCGSFDNLQNALHA